MTIKGYVEHKQEVSDIQRAVIAELILERASQTHPDLPPEPSPEAQRLAQRLLKISPGNHSSVVRGVATRNFHGALQDVHALVEEGKISSVEGRLLEARVLVYIGEYEKAIDSFHQAIRIGGEDPLTTAEIGYARLFEGQYREAIQTGEQLLQGTRLTNQIRVTAMTLMGRAQYAEGDVEGAVVTLRDALKILDNLQKGDPLETAAVVNDLGQALSELGQYKDAEKFLSRALEVRKLRGANALDLSESYNNFGLLRARQKHYDEAETLYRKSIEILRQEFGDRHPELAMEWNNLGSLYFDQSRFGEAEPLYRGALDLWVEFLGPDHLDVARAHMNLGTVYHRQRRFSAAEDCYQKALSIASLPRYNGHPYYGIMMINLGTLNADKGAEKEAEQWYEKGLASLEKSASKSGYTLYLVALKKAADFYTSVGRVKRAGELRKKMSAIQDTEQNSSGK